MNPEPIDYGDSIKKTKEQGFLRFDSYYEFKSALNDLLDIEMNFFSGMRSKEELGKIIETANNEASYEKKGERFLSLIKE